MQGLVSPERDGYIGSVRSQQQAAEEESCSGLQQSREERYFLRNPRRWLLNDEIVSYDANQTEVVAS